MQGNKHLDSESTELLIEAGLNSGKPSWMYGPQDVAYLIHGSPFDLHLNYSEFRTVLVHQRIPGGKGFWNQDWQIVHGKGVFKGLGNYYRPFVDLYFFKWSPKFPRWFYVINRFWVSTRRIKLKIEFPNVINQDISLNLHHRILSLIPLMSKVQSVQEPSCDVPEIRLFRSNLKFNTQAFQINYPSIVPNKVMNSAEFIAFKDKEERAI
jgi:hypothetical protein